MRSSQKSGRSRGKNNRNRNAGHSLNRVYESAGPEGKVRGTPQQVIDKYLSLARDAQLSGDRVTGENFLQHAEHYARILISVQEGNERRDQQPQQPQDNNRQDQSRQDQPRQDQPRQDQSADQGSGEAENQPPAEKKAPAPQMEKPAAEAPAEVSRMEEPAPPAAEEPARKPRRRAAAPRKTEKPAESVDQTEKGASGPDSFASINGDGESDFDLVETPESKPKTAVRKPRRPRAPKAAAPEADGASETTD